METFQANTRVEIGKGIHVAERESITVKQAGVLWLVECKAEDLEPTTVEQHLRLHIVPFIGATKLLQIAVPTVDASEQNCVRKADPPQRSKVCSNRLAL